MNMRKKLGIVLIIGLILIYAMTSNVLGYSFTTTLTPDNTSVSKGGTVVVTIKLSGIDAGKGLFNFSAVLNYDTEVFEEVTSSDIVAVADGGWTCTYSADTKKILLENTNWVTTDQDIATITLRVKSDTTASSATVGLTEVKAANESEEISGTELSTSIQIINGSGGGAVIPQNTTTGNEITSNTIGNNDVPADENFINEIEGLTDENDTSDEDVPYTGTENYIVPLIVIALILGVISFINYKKLDNKN